jgi:amidophosphoribosyltransferase
VKSAAYSPRSGVPHAAEVVGLGLHALQHRGQESTGIVSCDERGDFHTHKGLGLVSDVYDQGSLARLPGTLAIGHNRYSTTGSITLENTQPLRVVTRGGTLAIAHNGNLVNARELRQGLEGSGSIFQPRLDTEIFLHLMALSATENAEEALIEATKQVRGAYSMVLLTSDAVLAIRDPHGFRPLCIGRLGDGYVVASETCALDLVAAEFVAMSSRASSCGSIRKACEHGDSRRWLIRARHCIFEHIYFSRPDSRVFGETVDRVRRRIGHRLAEEQPADGDLVISVPDSSNSIALGYSERSAFATSSG